MSVGDRLIDSLREIAGGDLLQEQPHPVVAPQFVDDVPRIVRAVRDEQGVLLVLGTGSSFPADFALPRERPIVALLMQAMPGIQRTSTGARILAGTPVREVLMVGEAESRRTIGGLLASRDATESRDARAALWARVVTMTVVTGDGELKSLPGPLRAGVSDSGTASAFLGSRGRLGIIMSIDVFGGLPIRVNSKPDGDLSSASTGGGDAAVTWQKARELLDPSGLFNW